MSQKTSNSINIIVAYVSLILNLAYLGSWFYFSKNSTGFDEAKANFEGLWKVDVTYLTIALIILSIFSFIYFARTIGIVPKILMLVQIIIAGWLSWSLL